MKLLGDKHDMSKKNSILNVELGNHTKAVFKKAVCEGRDQSIDILKGISILLVVYGHTWPFCRNFIYLFHMAVFLMASGYCYSNQVSSLKEYRCYIFKKIKKLYIPFVICNGFFILLTPLFLKIGFYTINPIFLKLTNSWPIKQSLYVNEGVIGRIKQMLKVVAFIGPTQIGTATWFLTSLFIVLVLHSGLILVTKRFAKKKVIIVILIIMLLATQIVSSVNLSLPYFVKCIPCTYSVFLFGLLLKQWNRNIMYSWKIGIVAFFILILLSCNFSIEFSAAKVDNLFVYIVASLMGWVLLKSISELILYKNNIIADIMKYVGKHTLQIMCLHVLAFKLVSFVYIIIEHKPMVLLAGFHVIFDANQIWKIIYLVVGVLLPIGVYEIYRRIVKLIYSVYRT